MSNDARPNGTIQRPHQRSIQHNWFLRFHNIRRSAPCRTLVDSPDSRLRHSRRFNRRSVAPQKVTAKVTAPFGAAAPHRVILAGVTPIIAPGNPFLRTVGRYPSITYATLG